MSEIYNSPEKFFPPTMRVFNG